MYDRAAPVAWNLKKTEILYSNGSNDARRAAFSVSMMTSDALRAGDDTLRVRRKLVAKFGEPLGEPAGVACGWDKSPSTAATLGLGIPSTAAALGLDLADCTMVFVSRSTITRRWGPGRVVMSAAALAMTAAAASVV